MNILRLPELKRLQEALLVKRLIERRVDAQLAVLHRYHRSDVVKTRRVNMVRLQYIFYAYLANQNKDVDKDKLVILPIEYYNHELFNRCTCVGPDNAYSKVTEPAKTYLLQTDTILFTIDEVINIFNKKHPTTHNEASLYTHLLNNSKDYSVILYLVKNLIKEELECML